jgi:hypothetical protein
MHTHHLLCFEGWVLFAPPYTHSTPFVHPFLGRPKHTHKEPPPPHTHTPSRSCASTLHRSATHPVLRTVYILRVACSAGDLPHHLPRLVRQRSVPPWVLPCVRAVLIIIYLTPPTSTVSCYPNNPNNPNNPAPNPIAEGATVMYHASIMTSYLTPFLGAALGDSSFGTVTSVP